MFAVSTRRVVQSVASLVRLVRSNVAGAARSITPMRCCAVRCHVAVRALDCRATSDAHDCCRVVISVRRCVANSVSTLDYAWNAPPLVRRRQQTLPSKWSI